MGSSKPKAVWSEVADAIAAKHMESTITVTLLDSLIDKLDQMAEAKGVSRDEFIERLIAEKSRAYD